MTDEKKVEAYLNLLAGRLAPLAEPTRREILREIATHIRDAAEEPGRSISEILTSLGTPKELASQYAELLLLERARRSFSPLLLLKAVFRLAGKGIAGALVFFFAVSGYLIGAGILVTALMKPLFPGKVGLWVGGRGVLWVGGRGAIAGLIKQVPEAPVHEVLGWWYIPVALVAGVLLLAGTTALIQSFLRLSRSVGTRLGLHSPRAGFSLSLFAIVAVFLSASLSPSRMFAQDQKSSPVGDWVGSLDVQSKELHLALHITAKEGGAFQVSLDSIDQGAKAIPGEAATLSDHDFSFDIPAIHGHYQGILSSDGAMITGKWTQGPASLELVWRRGQAAALERPQEPKPPFSYKQEEVWVDNAKAGVRLAGTLTVPSGTGPFPAVFLITGSGPQDRDESVFGHKPFLVLADYLTQHGVAVLRVDDRGTGKSTGVFKGATTQDFAGDALAAVQFLLRRVEVDHAHIGLIGHSEGGVIAPMVAVQSHDVAFIVLLAGTAVPGEVLLPEQIYRSALADGQPEAEARSEALHIAQFMAAFDRGGDTEKALQIMKALPESGNPGSSQLLEQEAITFGGAWFRFFAGYDPYPTLRNVQCPVFALNGSKDVQVPAALNVPFLLAATAWNPRSVVEIVPGVNHLFQKTETGSSNEYARISETMSPTVLQEVSDWIHKQL